MIILFDYILLNILSKKTMKKSLIFLYFCIIFENIQAQNTNVFIAKPYLQIGKNPSAESLALLWHSADENANFSVEIKTSKSTNWTKMAMPTATRIAVSNIVAHKVYHANLTGLIAGKTFKYRVLKDEKEVFIADGKAPKNASQAYRFVAFGDIGAETTPQKKLALQAYKVQPDFLVVPGDIVYEKGLISEYRDKFWPIYNAEKADTLGAPIMRNAPIIAAPGNHDTDTRDLDKFPDALAYYYYWEQPLNGPLGEEGGPLVPSLTASEANRKAFNDAAGENYLKMSNYSFNYGNAHWTVIDSNPYVNYADSTILKWVANDLANSKEATWHFVLFHHPGFNSSLEHYEQQHLRLLSPIFEKGGVDVVFNGHVHNYQRSFPMTFAPMGKGTLIVGGKEGKSVRGRVVEGHWKLDHAYNGKTITKPKGIIYVITGAGGQDLYNPEQEKDPDSWQKFTDKFISTVHSLTVADVNGKTMTVKQLDVEGKELDRFVITK
jgi:acid phosphatase type 7